MKTVGNTVNREAGLCRPPVVALQHRIVIESNRISKASVACNLPRPEIAFKTVLPERNGRGFEGLGTHILPALAVFQIGSSRGGRIAGFWRNPAPPSGAGTGAAQRYKRPRQLKNRRSGEGGDTDLPIRAVDDGCVGLRKGLDALALAGGEDGGGDAAQGGAEQVFFHNGQCCQQ